MEPEVVVVTPLSNEVLWCRNLWQDLLISLSMPVPLWVDISATVSLTQHTGRFDGTNHINLNHLVVREHQNRDWVKVAWVAGEFQLLHVFTK
jgi:hypothetical protein